jgi:predicted nicotinamide N-methyase
MYKIGLEITQDWPEFIREMGEFISSNAALSAPPLVPEIKLYLAREIDPLWRMTEEVFQTKNIPPPFWAFAWPGGQALARYILDHPQLVAGKRVFDFASGSGLVALAAKMAGAAEVTANDIDPVAIVALTLNAKSNDLVLTASHKNMINAPMEGYDIILAGDFCYEWPMAGYAIDWMRVQVSVGLGVYFADPGRPHAPLSGIEECANYRVPTSRDLEDSDQKIVKVFRLLETAED